ncbi:response regulator [Histidinibacterium lentulum]|uniref:Response regulator n=1 Tax=Histidinibacterium lentulum TaxID=2480588 RepID=A0A3N2QY36_9RHOB|nr:response regulator [Histidinibacterium lentulum]ROU00097.1 response regulator [Histidinibacterium lentulum]
MTNVLSVLVIEDEALIAMELECLLEDLGHNVRGVAGSVNSAVRLVQACDGEVDAALLDANLGGDSAIPVAEALVEAGTPFVITSGYEQHELFGRGFDAPVVRKPYREADIADALTQIARRRAEGDQGQDD